MLRKSAIALLVAYPAINNLVAQDLATKPTAPVQTMHSAEVAKRSEDVRQAMIKLQAARTAYSAGRYSEAVEGYEAALALVPQAEATKQTREFIILSLSDALIAKAIDYREVGRIDEAVSFLERAIEIAPSSKLAKEELSKTQDPIRTNPANTPQHQANVAEVNRLLNLAYAAYDLANYDEAEATFTSVLRIDPYNSAAQRGKEQVMLRKAKYHNAARDAIRAHALENVDAELVDGLDNASMHILPRDFESQEVALVTPQDVAAQSLATYLGEIKIDQIAFDDASLSEVVETLQGLLRRGAAENPQAGTPSNLTTNFGLPDSKGYKELNAKTLRLSLSNISFKDLLDVVSQQLGISYFYVPTGIELTYSGKDFGPMIERTFSVPPHFFSSNQDNTDNGGFGDIGTTTVRRISPIEQLKEMGVSFPEGATARYSPSSRTLTVRNTGYNQEHIADLLNVSYDGEKLIVLNVYVMSISKEVLEELGFEILLSFDIGNNTTAGGGTEQTSTTLSPMPSIEGIPDSEAPYVTSGLRSGSQVFEGNSIESLISAGSVGNFASAAASPKNPYIFGFRGVWSVADLTVLMHGLSQKTDADILQNPQLVFQAGADEQVSIACVREMYYPENYDPPEISSSSRYSLATPAKPSEFTYFGITEDQFNGIGTLLQVHSAELVQDGKAVDLALSTTVNEFEGFINWGSPIYSTVSSGDEIGTFMLTDNQILKPLFKRTYQNTKVTIQTGNVLVLGGLQESKKIRFEDKIPVLGDLPFVGRLFRSAGEQEQSKVLLFFAKVNVIDPTGVDVQSGQTPDKDFLQ